MLMEIASEILLILSIPTTSQRFEWRQKRRREGSQGGGRKDTHCLKLGLKHLADKRKSRLPRGQYIERGPRQLLKFFRDTGHNFQEGNQNEEVVCQQNLLKAAQEAKVVEHALSWPLLWKFMQNCSQIIRDGVVNGLEKRVRVF